MVKTAQTSFAFCCCIVASIVVVGEMTVSTNAFLKPFAKHLMMKKMMLKHSLGEFFAPRPSPVVIYNGVHYPPQPAPRPSPVVNYGGAHRPPQPAPPSPQPPRVTYPAYGPQPSSSPAYGPPLSSYGGYESPSPSVMAKPQQQPPQSGCAHSSPQVDYSSYATHSGHEHGSDGNGVGYGN